MCVLVFRVLWGSSPLTRGGLCVRHRCLPLVGLIPAYAGRTLRSIQLSYRRRAHPRLRGADGISWYLATAEEGSSPLTRGGLIINKSPLHFSGLIPAYAGRTRGGAYRPTDLWAHPRLRGADFPGPLLFSPLRGSSPLTRGGPGSVTSSPKTTGLIPAYAGRTPRPPRTRNTPWAHPRLRGADFS